MHIENSKNIIGRDVNTNGGDVRIGDIYNKSIEYKEIQERIEELKELANSSKDDEKKLKFSKRLNEKIKQKEAFENEVISLAEIFQKIQINKERLKKAKQFFNEGKLKEARALLELDVEQIGIDQKKLLNRDLELEEKSKQSKIDLRHNSDEYLVLAKLTAINFELENWFEKTLEYYELSLMSNRNEDNLFSYAYFLQRQNQNNKAVPLYQKALEEFRKLAEVNPKTYLPDVASILNNIGILQKNRNELEQAEKSYSEALEIYRKLAKSNKQKYSPEIAGTLSNLGILLCDKSEFEQAEKSYKEALKIYRQFAEANQQNYLPDTASILNNLGILQRDKKEFEQAEKSYKEALKIYQQLAEVNPQTYLPHVSTTFNNLAVLQRDKKEFEQAEKSYEEALIIRRHLAEINPQTYLPDLAMTLNNLGILQRDKKEVKQAEKSYREALKKYRKLAEVNPQTYLMGVGSTLNNLANLQRDENELEQAEKSYGEALEIYRQLAEINPQTYLQKLAITQINLAIFYQEYKSNKEISIQLVDEAVDVAITNLLPIAKTPNIQNYLKKAFQILQNWDIDVKAYINKKLEDD